MLLVLPLLGQVGGEEVEEKVVKVVKEVGREGENICHTEELESHLVNTTYLESVKVGSKIIIVRHSHILMPFQVKKHYACLRIPPVCAEWVNKMETRWREENITR